jgi:hypothetical protein
MYDMYFEVSGSLEFQREFNHVTQNLPTVVRVPIVFLLNMVWVYSKIVV